MEGIWNLPYLELKMLFLLLSHENNPTTGTFSYVKLLEYITSINTISRYQKTHLEFAYTENYNFLLSYILKIHECLFMCYIVIYTE
jgi:hypothetical protein